MLLLSCWDIPSVYQINLPKLYIIQASKFHVDRTSMLRRHAEKLAKASNLLREEERSVDTPSRLRHASMLGTRDESSVAYIPMVVPLRSV